MDKQKPIEIIYAKFQKELVDLINASGLPAFIVAQTLQVALAEVGKIADENHRRAVDEYNKVIEGDPD